MDPVTGPAGWKPEIIVDPRLPDDVALIYPASLEHTIAQAVASGLPLALEHARSMMKITGLHG